MLFTEDCSRCYDTIRFSLYEKRNSDLWKVLE